jgi:hypothetical protein
MKAMVRYFMRSPDELTLEDINSYQQHLTRERKVGWGAFNQSVCAIRFFYGVTLGRDWDIQQIPYQKTGRKLPVVLSCEEVSQGDPDDGLRRWAARVGGYALTRQRR